MSQLLRVHIAHIRGETQLLQLLRKRQLLGFKLRAFASRRDAFVGWRGDSRRERGRGLGRPEGDLVVSDAVLDAAAVGVEEVAGADGGVFLVTLEPVAGCSESAPWWPAGGRFVGGAEVELPELAGDGLDEREQFGLVFELGVADKLETGLREH